MNNRGLIGAAILLGSVAAGPAAWAADSKTFISDAIQGNFAEIAVGQLAQQKGSTEQVKQFGQSLVTDHTKANQNALEVAKTLGVTAPTGPTSEQKAMHDKLAGESGASFDRDFVAGMVADHKKDITMYQAAGANKDATGQYATQTLPDLEKHLQTAQSLNGQGGQAAGTAASADDGALQAGANSFTEGQAKSRIEDAGYTNVTGLKKDDNGVWRGTASKAGQTGPVGLDFKGHVGTK